MATADKKPFVLAQNRLAILLGSAPARLRFYRQVLDRRLAETERYRDARLQVPRSRGLRLMLPGKPFHATPELFFQERGTTRFALPHENLTTGPRQAALIPAGMPHGERWTGVDFLNVIMMFYADGFSLHLGRLVDGTLRSGSFDRFPSTARANLIGYLEEMARTGEDGAGRAIRRGLYLAFLARLREGLERGARAEERSHPLLRRCLELIDIHFTRMDFSVVWLARELDCSPDHLSRLFRREAGQRLIQFIHQKRTDYACRLLREADMNVAETAWACGFSQPSYFNRIFRAYAGLTPQQHRNNFATTGPKA